MFKELLRTDILVKLPQGTDDVLVKQKSGIYVSTLSHKEKYNPTYGEVVEVSEGAQHAKAGDVVFFGNHLWDVAKRRAFGDEDERYRGHYTADKVFAVKDGADYYMILPEEMIYFLRRGKELIGMNGIVIAEPIAKEKEQTHSGLIIVDLSEETYVENKMRVFLAPNTIDVAKGDVVHTLRHCDIAIEEELNNPILPAKYFFVEAENIIAKEV
jgi:co-chaperonin GroES (HSP10)